MITRLLVHWLITALSLLFAAYLLDGVTVVSGYTALITAALIGVVNITIRPVLLVLTLPLNILTLGLFTFVINALMFWFVASFVEGFAVDGFLAALLGSLLVTLFSWLGMMLFSKQNTHVKD